MSFLPDVFIIIFGITVQELVQMSVPVLSDLVANHGKFNLDIMCVCDLIMCQILPMAVNIFASMSAHITTNSK